MTIFNSFLYVYQRVPCFEDELHYGFGHRGYPFVLFSERDPYKDLTLDFHVCRGNHWCLNWTNLVWVVWRNKSWVDLQIRDFPLFLNGKLPCFFQWTIWNHLTGQPLLEVFSFVQLRGAWTIFQGMGQRTAVGWTSDGHLTVWRWKTAQFS